MIQLSTHRRSSRSMHICVDSTSNIVMYHRRHGRNVETSRRNICTDNNHTFLRMFERFDGFETSSLWKAITKNRVKCEKLTKSENQRRNFETTTSAPCHRGSEIVHVNPHGHPHRCHFDEQWEWLIHINMFRYKKDLRHGLWHCTKVNFPQNCTQDALAYLLHLRMKNSNIKSECLEGWSHATDSRNWIAEHETWTGRPLFCCHQVCIQMRILVSLSALDLFKR